MFFCQVFFLQSCSDSLYVTTFEMVYKLNAYKRKVKVFPATASYSATPAVINDCYVAHRASKSLPSNVKSHTELIGAIWSRCTKRPQTSAVHDNSWKCSVLCCSLMPLIVNNSGFLINPRVQLELIGHSRLFIFLRCHAKLDRNPVHDKNLL